MADMVNTNESQRSSSAAEGKKAFAPGPFVAIVRNHLDTTFMGGLEVEILSQSSAGNSTNAPGQIVAVKYLSPFYGVTSYDGMNKNTDHRNSQRSYGFWGVPPDIGAKVLVIFAEGGQGFWIGCIPEENTNIMVPDQMVSTTFNSKDKSKKLPVVEYNKKTEKGIGRDTTQFIKPANQDAIDLLTTQGLLDDDVRGVTSSSSRRELPSAVVGISSPGPADKRPGAPRVNYGENFAQTAVPQNRLGGTSLVFDDGDVSLLRKKPAGEAPPEYVNAEAGEKGGDPTLLHNELVRLRTRTGHQILLHNTEDLIYIGNAKGTTWVELTSNGKIDIFAEDSISIHTKQDLNVKADRDFNLEVGRDFNVKANNDINFESVQDITTYSNRDTVVTTKRNVEMKSDGQNNFTAGAETNILSGGNHIETAPEIHMNGPEALVAANTVPFDVFLVPGEDNKVIMKRVPQHEPWPHHENLDPTKVTPEKTNIYLMEDIVDPVPQKKTDTFKKSVKREAGEKPASSPPEAEQQSTTTKTTAKDPVIKKPTETTKDAKLSEKVQEAVDKVNEAMSPANVAKLQSAITEGVGKLDFPQTQALTGAIDKIASPSTLSSLQKIAGPAVSSLKQAASDLSSLRTTLAKGLTPIANTVQSAFTTTPNSGPADRAKLSNIVKGFSKASSVQLSSGNTYGVTYDADEDLYMLDEE